MGTLENARNPKGAEVRADQEECPTRVKGRVYEGFKGERAGGEEVKVDGCFRGMKSDHIFKMQFRRKSLTA